MAERKNKFMSDTRGSVNLRKLTQSVNEVSTGKGHSATLESKTEKQVEDIDISLVDEYDKNELLFGYNNLNDVKSSIEKTGTQGVTINVFTTSNGRYLCYSGNTRLKALKELGEKKITCIIEGPVPDDHELMLRAIHGNTQREFDPYHIALEIDMLEKSYREKGLVGSLLTDEIESVTGYKLTSQKTYKQILKLHPSLQTLFNSKDVPFKYLLKVCKSLNTDNAEEFATNYTQLVGDNEPTSELIDAAYARVTRRPSTGSYDSFTPIKLGSIYKPILNLSSDGDGHYYIPKSKREEYLAQVEALEDELKKIKEACKA